MGGIIYCFTVYTALSVAVTATATATDGLNATALRGRAATSTSQCPPGTQWMTVTPSTSLELETASPEIVCELCEVGRSSESGHACNKCASGSYQDLRGASTCKSTNATCSSFLHTGATTEAAAAECRPRMWILQVILITVFVGVVVLLCCCLVKTC